jgi:hypothetical protein
MNLPPIEKRVIDYVNRMSLGAPGRYKSSAAGGESLYASCFAAMIMDYVGCLDGISPEAKQAWVDYIQSYQDHTSGYFIGPEISEGELESSAHSKEHLMLHLTAHVLPALKALDAKPRYPLTFGLVYLDPAWRENWLTSIDWSRAWIEGNNLLFVGQILTYLYEDEGVVEAKQGVFDLLDWLDGCVDEKTGVWGTQGSCDIRPAVYGGYHQLLLYYYWRREVKHRERLIDAVLAMQHFDGGFSDSFGGGTCEDVDCVDILVNLYKCTQYRRTEVERSLRRAGASILRKINTEGGFYYKRGIEFLHMGMRNTYAPPGVANMFSTWFSIHTLALIGEIVDLPQTRGIRGRFNKCCSMGWHEHWDHTAARNISRDFLQVWLGGAIYHLYYGLKAVKEGIPLVDRIYRSVRQLGHSS